MQHQCCGAPAPSVGTPASAVWDAMKPWYTKTMSPATAQLAISLLGHLDLLEDTSPESGQQFRVVETHCADARAAGFLLPAAGVCEYTACDFSEAMVTVASQRLQGRAKVILGDSTKLPFEDASFDRYLSNMGCCCVSDLDAKLREARRVLCAGGRAAMSMRIEGGVSDTSFALIAQTLRRFGFPPPPDREGLHLGKDLPKLRAKVLGTGFASAVVWNSWITLPIHDTEGFLGFANGQPPVKKFLGTLDEDSRQQALVALEAASKDALQQGAIQIAVAVVVAQV